jgi:hypothetical protein
MPGIRGVRGPGKRGRVRPAGERSARQWGLPVGPAVRLPKAALSATLNSGGPTPRRACLLREITVRSKFRSFMRCQYTRAPWMSRGGGVGMPSTVVPPLRASQAKDALFAAGKFSRGADTSVRRASCAGLSCRAVTGPCGRGRRRWDRRGEGSRRTSCRARYGRLHQRVAVQPRVPPDVRRSARPGRGPTAEHAARGGIRVSRSF